MVVPLDLADGVPDEAPNDVPRLQSPPKTTRESKSISKSKKLLFMLKIGPSKYQT